MFDCCFGYGCISLVLFSGLFVSKLSIFFISCFILIRASGCKNPMVVVDSWAVQAAFNCIGAVFKCVPVWAYSEHLGSVSVQSLVACVSYL